MPNKRHIIGIIFLTLTLLTFNNCDFIVDNEQENSQIEQAESIAINREEAQLLVKIAKTNSEIITLSHQVKNNPGDTIEIAQILEAKHILISKTLHKIAEDKLILIPDTTYEKEMKLLLVKKSADLYNDYLHTISDLLENQIHTLNKLRVETSDQDFKTLSTETKKVLKANLNRTKTLLNNSDA